MQRVWQGMRRWGWWFVFLMAAVLRLAALNATPLAPAEAARALQAWDAARLGVWPIATDSAFLLTGNTLLFWLFGPGDGIARLWPALAGCALVAVPLRWRRHIGGPAALAAAGLLAISPLLVFASRQVSGVMPGLLGGALLFTGLLDYRKTSSYRPTSATALVVAGVALGLTGGSAFYDLLLTGAFAWGFYRLTMKSAPGLDWGRLWPALLYGVGGALLISWGWGMRWGGLAGPVEGLLAWLAEWQPAAAPNVLMLLVLYEPFTLLLAVVSIVLAAREGQPLPLALGLTTVALLLLMTLRLGVTPAATAAAMLPLALLGGQTLQRLARQAHHFTWIGEGVHTPLACAFWIFAGLVLARHTAGYRSSGLEFPLVFLIVMIQLFMVGTFAMFVGRAAAARAFFMATATILLCVQLAFGWGVNFTRAGSPVEPLITQGASPDLRQLRAVLEDVRRDRYARDPAFTVALVAGEPELTAVLRWTLRDLSQLQVTTAWPETTSAAIIVAPEGSTPLHTPDSPWRGLAFTALTSPGLARPACEHLPSLHCPAPIAWYLYRRTPENPQLQRAVLWVAP
ncbi:MAG TPA: hypothetical protein ENN14_01775 [Chloroflexi bacterium]|nr:hypothetical protein [Chloroflexota bacterium]